MQLGRHDFELENWSGRRDPRPQIPSRRSNSFSGPDEMQGAAAAPLYNRLKSFPSGTRDEEAY